MSLKKVSIMFLFLAKKNHSSSAEAPFFVLLGLVYTVKTIRRRKKHTSIVEKMIIAQFCCYCEYVHFFYIKEKYTYT